MLMQFEQESELEVFANLLNYMCLAKEKWPQRKYLLHLDFYAKSCLIYPLLKSLVLTADLFNFKR